MLISDFYIAAVQWEGDGCHQDGERPQKKFATRFLIHPNGAAQLGTPYWVDRQVVIALLKENYLLQIIPGGDLSRLSYQGRVFLICVAGQDYLRIDQQPIAGDELGAV